MEEVTCPACNKPNGEHTEDCRLMKAARDEFYNDEINIDEDARVSPNDEGGCWVQAWVYVHDEEWKTAEELAAEEEA
jgi:hypothetical protein